MSETNPATRVAGSGSQYCFGAFRLDVAGRKIWQGDQPVHLTGRVFEALATLVRHADQVVTKEELVKAIWPDSFVTDDSLTQCIWSVRRVLGDEATQPQFVVTVPRQGYRFIAPVTIIDRRAEVPETASEPAAAAMLAPDTAPPPSNVDLPRLPAGVPAAVGRVRLPWMHTAIGAAATSQGRVHAAAV